MQMCATALYSVTIVFWKEIAFFVELLTGIATEMLFPQCDSGDAPNISYLLLLALLGPHRSRPTT